MERETYITKLKRYYDDQGRLTQYPSKRPLRLLALGRITETFQVGKTYTEREVNSMILSAIAFGDHELIRRELIDYRFLGRLRDGSKYWVEPDWSERYQDVFTRRRETADGARDCLIVSEDAENLS